MSPAVSKSQRRYFAMCEHGKATKGTCPKGMTKSQMRDFAKTKEKGLPERKRTRTRRSEWSKLTSR